MSQLLSAGFSVRPRPLDLWLDQLAVEAIPTVTDIVATLNQLGLIAYFNGNAELAGSISRHTIRHIVNCFGASQRHLAIQPWVNIGRIEIGKGCWREAKKYFELPKYLNQSCAPPAECPISDWGDRSKHAGFVRFAWAVYLEEAIKALTRDLISEQEFLEIIAFCSEAPDEFLFSVNEARLILHLRRHSITLDDVTFFNQPVASVRQLASFHARKAEIAFAVGAAEDGIAHALKSYLVSYTFTESESADPFLSIAFFVARLLVGHGQTERARPILHWLTRQSLALNHEIMHFEVHKFGALHRIFAHDNRNVVSRDSFYRRINPDAKDLGVRISQVAERCFDADVLTS